jgi:hypothetical protein
MSQHHAQSLRRSILERFEIAAAISEITIEEKLKGRERSA